MLRCLGAKGAGVTLCRTRRVLGSTRVGSDGVKLLCYCGDLCRVCRVGGLGDLTFRCYLGKVRLARACRISGCGLSPSCARITGCCVRRGGFPRTLRVLGGTRTATGTDMRVLLKGLNCVRCCVTVTSVRGTGGVLRRIRGLVTSSGGLSVGGGLCCRGRFFCCGRAGRCRGTLTSTSTLVGRRLHLGRRTLHDKRCHVGKRVCRTVKEGSLTTSCLSGCVRLRSSTERDGRRRSVDRFTALIGVRGLGSRGGRLVLRTRGGRLCGGRVLVLSLTTLLVFIFVFLCERGELGGQLLRSRRRLEGTGGTTRSTDRVGALFVRDVDRRVHAPLGSVMKFSRVLKSHCQSSPSAGMCTSVVRTGDRGLLHLIASILRLSSLSGANDVPTSMLAGVGSYYGRDLRDIHESMRRNIGLLFRSRRSRLVIGDGPRHVVRILVGLLRGTTGFAIRNGVALACAIVGGRRGVYFTMASAKPNIPLSERR